MKRIFALMISLLLVTFLFAACGDDDTYRQPGTGTTLGGKVTTPAADDQNGSYSADLNGDVNQTTDNNNIIENGINDIENGLEEGMNDLENGINDLEQGAEEMFGGNGGNNANGADGANGDDEMLGVERAEDVPNYEGIAGESDPAAIIPEDGNNNSAANNEGGYSNGATNGNSH